MKKVVFFFGSLMLFHFFNYELLSQNNTASFEIDKNKTSGLISSLWFGHNLEHTRSAMYQGLSAQLIRNRKFATKSEHTGQAIGWDAVGAEHTWFYLLGYNDNVYTCHYNMDDGRRRFNEMQSQLIENFTDSLESGIGQTGIHLTAKREYEGKIALKSTSDIPVSVTLYGCKNMKTYFTKVLMVKAGDWMEFRYVFNSIQTDDNCAIKITFKKKGVLIIGAISLLPADNFFGMRRDVIEKLKQISVPILRWPGGNFAGDYRWQDGLLPCDRRAPLMSGAYMEQETQPYSYGSDNHEIGTDEYIQLCHEINAVPFITVNLAWEDPETCAEWVEYCNGSISTKWGQIRSERGYPEPYNIKHWSLGNELLYEHMEGGFSKNKSAYAAKIKGVAEAMLKADSTILLTMSGYLENNEYMALVLPYLHSISYHSYTSTDFGSLPTLLNNDLFAKIVEYPANSFKDIKQIYNRINQVIPMAKPVSISFDEWNLWYSWYAKSNVRSGIHTASYLNEFCKEGSSSGVSIGCYFQPVNEGAIEVYPDSATLTAAGQVFELYKEHHNNTLVQVKGVSPEISVLSSLNPEKTQLVITVVNLSPEKERTIIINLKGIENTSLVGAKLFLGQSYDPGSKFVIRDLPIKMKYNKLEFILNKHSIGNIILGCSKN